MLTSELQKNSHHNLRIQCRPSMTAPPLRPPPSPPSPNPPPPGADDDDDDATTATTNATGGEEEQPLPPPPPPPPPSELRALPPGMLVHDTLISSLGALEGCGVPKPHESAVHLLLHALGLDWDDGHRRLWEAMAYCLRCCHCVPCSRRCCSCCRPCRRRRHCRSTPLSLPHCPLLLPPLLLPASPPPSP